MIEASVGGITADYSAEITLEARQAHATCFLLVPVVAWLIAGLLPPVGFSWVGSLREPSCCRDDGVFSAAIPAILAEKVHLDGSVSHSCS